MVLPCLGTIPSHSCPIVCATLNCNCRSDLPTAPFPVNKHTSRIGNLSSTVHSCRGIAISSQFAKLIIVISFFFNGCSISCPLPDPLVLRSCSFKYLTQFSISWSVTTCPTPSLSYSWLCLSIASINSSLVPPCANQS